MDKVKAFTTLIPIIVFLSGCCLNFSDLTPGTEYFVGDTITTSRLNISVESFQYCNGSTSSSGSVEVSDQIWGGGSGNLLYTRAVNLNFFLPSPDATEIKFGFGELGGCNNIKINEEFQIVNDFIDLNNTSIGGADITVNAAQSGANWHGQIILTGTINHFSIGGEEFAIGNVCISY